MKEYRIRKITDIILIAIFVCFITLPFLGYVFRIGGMPDLGEKRNLAKAPILGVDPVEDIPEKFDAFYNDHFGFRNGLIRAYNILKYRFLKSGSIGKVVMGRDGWLFLTKKGIISDYLGHKQYTPEELRAWKDSLEKKQQWCSERGIRYLFFIAPNKSSIYSEMLPQHITSDRGRTLMDQLVKYLRVNSDVEFVDLRDILQDSKEQGLMYYPRDSHWTDRGAFVVYQALCKYISKWFPEIELLSMDDFTITSEQRPEDLATMLGLGKELSEETEVFVRRTASKARLIELDLPKQYSWPVYIALSPQWSMENESAENRLLFFHDSFAVRGALMNLLGEHFSRSVFIPLWPDMDCLELMVEMEKPDIIIEEIVERKLEDSPPQSIIED